VAISGIAELNYAVEDLEKCIAFFEDFGLSKLESSGDHAVFEVVSGQRVNLMRLGDSRIPKSGITGPGVHECLWAVSDADSLKQLVDDLARDHELVTDAAGVVHFVTAFGQAIGLKVFQPRPLTSSPSPTNAPGVVNRMNVPRKWPVRAIPKTISHVVWTFVDVNEAFYFYRDRLGFKLSDVQKGLGLYIRGSGSTNHHNVAMIDASVTMLGLNGRYEFHHVNFGVEDLDEIMVGKNYLERRGYNTEGWGFGRHRISSELFLYVPSPAGGEVEYGADCDQCDDNWRPRVWGAAFATFTFVHNMPDWLLAHEPEWDLTFTTPQTARHLPAKP
jgi:catechol 2,3-dioxygenase-like lactoylglutathione lyase family enzyme